MKPIFIKSTLALILCQISLSALADDDSSVMEVMIEGRKSDYSVITENAQKIIDAPGSLGDPLMAVFSLPGVLSEGETGGSPAVRGSSPSDNLYLVDGAPAGYVFHAFSTSIFNENIIQDFELFSAGFGPRYSNAIGGVFDIKLRDPKSQAITTKVDLSLLRAGVFVEGDITENSAFYFSGRNSLIQYFFDEDTVEKEDGIRVQDAPEDKDYQFKYQYRLGDQHKFTLSANGATDLAAAEFTEISTEVFEEPDFAGDAKIETSFNNQNLRWQWAGDISSADVQIGHYDDKSETFWGDHNYFFNLNTKDNYAVANYTFQIGDQHQITVGAEAHDKQYQYDARFINYVCTEIDPDCLLRRGDLIDTKDSINIKDNTVFINDHWVMTDRFNIDIGVQRHQIDYTDETFTHPRLAATWEFIDNWYLSSSAGSYDRLPDIDKLFPIIGNTDLKSPESDHFTMGIKHEMDNEWSWSVTGYYKTMDQLPLATDVNNSNLPPYTNNVEGEAYGVDLFINKNLTDRWYGWLAISASRSLRTNKLTNIEQDYYLDTPLVINWVMNYQINELWNLGTRLTLQSGRAITPIIGAQVNPYFDNHILPIYGEANSDRLPVYARLDLRVKRDMTLFGFSGNYNIDILNVLNRQNVTDRNLDYKHTNSLTDYKLVDNVGMGIIPAIGMSLTF